MEILLMDLSTYFKKREQALYVDMSKVERKKRQVFLLINTTQWT